MCSMYERAYVMLYAPDRCCIFNVGFGLSSFSPCHTHTHGSRMCLNECVHAPHEETRRETGVSNRFQKVLRVRRYASGCMDSMLCGMDSMHDTRNARVVGSRTLQFRSARRPLPRSFSTGLSFRMPLLHPMFMFTHILSRLMRSYVCIRRGAVFKTESHIRVYRKAVGCTIFWGFELVLEIRNRIFEVDDKSYGGQYPKFWSP